MAHFDCLLFNNNLFDINKLELLNNGSLFKSFNLYNNIFNNKIIIFFNFFMNNFIIVYYYLLYFFNIYCSYC